MKTKVYNQKFESSSEVDLNPKIYEVKPQAELIQLAVRAQRANSRPSIAHTKNRGEVSGGGKKPWKQKGTGNARAGSTRSPIWRHGGITFGPRSDRNYSLKINKKMFRKALFMTLSDKAMNSQFFVFSDLNLDQPKTKQMSSFLTGLKSKVAKDSKRFLVVIPAGNENIERASKNLKNTKVIRATSLNVIDIIEADSVILPQNSLELIEKTYLK